MPLHGVKAKASESCDTWLLNKHERGVQNRSPVPAAVVLTGYEPGAIVVPRELVPSASSACVDQRVDRPRLT